MNVSKELAERVVKMCYRAYGLLGSGQHEDVEEGWGNIEREVGKPALRAALKFVKKNSNDYRRLEGGEYPACECGVCEWCMRETENSISGREDPYMVDFTEDEIYLYELTVSWEIKTRGKVDESIVERLKEGLSQEEVEYQLHFDPAANF